MTLTIELAEADLARARIEGLDLTQIAREAARKAVADALHQDNVPPLSLSPPLAHALQQGFDAADAGRVVDGETVSAALRRRTGRI